MSKFSSCSVNVHGGLGKRASMCVYVMFFRYISAPLQPRGSGGRRERSRRSGGARVGGIDAICLHD